MKKCSYWISCLLLCFGATSLPNLGLAAEGKPGQKVELQFETSDSAAVKDLLCLPKNYAKQDNLRLALFPHGHGDSFGPISLVAKWGPPRFAARGDELPYILVSPQCTGDDNLSSETEQ